MTTKTLSWMLVLVLVIGAVASGASIGPAAGSVSDQETFENNNFGTADNWGNVEFTVKEIRNNSVTLKLTIRNDDDTPATAEYQVIVDNNTVDNGTIDLPANEERTETYDLNGSERESVEWLVNVNGNAERGSVQSNNSTES